MQLSPQSRTFSPPQNKLISNHYPSPSNTSNLSIWFCLFWTFHINATIKHVAFVSGFFYLTCSQASSIFIMDNLLFIHKVASFSTSSFLLLNNHILLYVYIILYPFINCYTFELFLFFGDYK